MPAPSPLPAHLVGLDEKHPLGTRRKVIAAVRDLCEQYLTAEDDKTVRALEGCRKAYAQLVKHYEDEVRWVQDFQLVQRVTELEAQLAAQHTGDGIVYSDEDSPFGGRPGEAAH